MAKSQQRISKGFYQYSQVNNFITVKNYMFIREKGKKCLLIRFVNDSDFTVDSMEYTVVQLGAGGQVIDNTRVACKKMNLAPGEMYASNESIVVDDYCSDFKVVFSCVRSGNYVYTVREGRAVADYILPEVALEIGEKKRGRKGKRSRKIKRRHRIKRFTVARKLISRPMIATLAPIVAVLLAILCAALYMARDYVKTIPLNGAWVSADTLDGEVEYGFEQYVET